jgi:nucleotide-binding universal stress UspA family protein
MKIFLAIDGSACSEAAVASVAQRPWPPKSEVRVVTVVPPVDPGFLRGASPTVFDEVVKQQLVDASTRLNNAVATIRENAPELSVTTTLLEGRPKETIVDEANRWGADLIVVGSHGYAAVRRLFLGSVSLAVATSAHCSVEIVRCPSVATIERVTP